MNKWLYRRSSNASAKLYMQYSRFAAQKPGAVSKPHEELPSSPRMGPVEPINPVDPSKPESSPSLPNPKLPNVPLEKDVPKDNRRRVLHILAALVDLGSWFLVLLLMMFQIVNIFVRTFKTDTIFQVGTNPYHTEISRIPGNNDDAYIDRAMTCIQVGRVYRAATLIDAMQDSTSLIQHANITDDSYTVMVRYDPQTTLQGTFNTFDSVCTEVALTIDGIAHACADQGYQPVTEALRINVGTDATHTTEIKNALPIVIQPYWDNAAIARYVLPGKDGVACSVKLYNQYVGSGTFFQVNVINRTDYDSHVRAWLQEPSGTWQNGWYTFPDRTTKYYANLANDLRSRDLPNGLGISSVVYDALTKKRIDCTSNPTVCQNQVGMIWEGVLSQNSSELWSECVNIQDKNRMGLIWYSVEHEYYLSNHFGWSVILANISVFGLLARWGIAFIASYRGYRCRTMMEWHGCGIGITSCSKSLVLLPVLLFPNFKFMSLCFWSSCIRFEGDLQVVSDAWNITYPCIAQFILVYFALLNWISKCFRLRTSDRTFGPVLAALCIGHYCRQITFESFGTSMGYIDRAETLFFASAFPRATITEVLFTQALLIGGNVKAIYLAKLIVLALPFLDLLLFSERVGPSCKYHPSKPCAIETTLAIAANYCGGLGKSPIYTRSSLNGYEVTRLGFIRFGPDNLISFNDYYVIISCYFSNIINETYNQRVLVLDMAKSPIVFTRIMYHWNDPRFGHRWYDVQSVDLE